jgi:hypothetical protein
MRLEINKQIGKEIQNLDLDLIVLCFTTKQILLFLNIFVPYEV